MGKTYSVEKKTEEVIITQNGTNEATNSNFEQTVQNDAHTSVLRAVGFLRAGTGRVHAAYRTLVLSATVFYLVQEGVYACSQRYHMDNLSRVMFLLLCHVTSLAKQLVFHADAARIDLLIDSLNATGCAEDRATLVYRFSAVLLYSYYVTTMVAIANTTTDAFIATLLYQCQTQFTILRLEFVSMTLFIFCILTELFLYCYFGNELTVESDQLAGAAYAMRWEDTSLPFRRSLLLLMLRARRPLRPAAGRVLPLSLETFLKILKSSYTFYAVLRQTK
ncbi:unnamed protein product [Leptidea sinapis]|uniref:Odorant receptor n=1 Tax=Leptidea sinapis TaxID=189913 RepID=A0A5E4QKA8_9NEOP|nr:unnamed protein product [Leptidea sinapis]